MEVAMRWNKMNYFLLKHHEYWSELVDVGNSMVTVMVVTAHIFLNLVGG